MTKSALLASAALAALLTVTAAAAPPIMEAPIVTDPSTYKVETIVSGLDHPWSLAFLPDGGMLVTERNNGLRLIRDGKLVGERLEGLPEAFKEGQGGYFDVVLDRDYATNGLIYVSYAEGTGEANHTAVARAKFDGAKLSDVTVILRNTPDKDTAAHFGARLVVLPDGSLLLTTGDGFQYREKAQDNSSGLGKILHFNIDGTPAANNPFLNEKGTNPLIWSYGHRNQQGLALDSATGNVYQTEHGALSGDEVNLITPGTNYGWPVATYSVDYSGSEISPYTDRPGMQAPIAVWKPERFAPSGLAVYHGALFPEWEGDLLAGGLAEQRVDRIDLDAAGKVVARHALFGELHERIRDVRVAPDGAVYLLTDTEDGKVLKVTPAG
jgi:glucose/arabinose dehydrogenase